MQATANLDYQWEPIERGGEINKFAMKAGCTKTDGPVYVGRRNGEVGKINATGSLMHNFWSHRLLRGEQRAEILRCGSGKTFEWTSIQRGDSIPETAILACHTERSSRTRFQDVVGKVMDKVCLTPKGGCGYIGRFNGEPGMITTVDGRMKSFWGHRWGERRCAEILTLKAITWEETGLRELPVRMRVLQFNVWQEGWEVQGGLDKIADIICASGADIVALSEVRNWYMRYMPTPFTDFHQRLKTALASRGHKFYGSWVEGTDVGIVSRWPIQYAEPVTVSQRSFMSAYHVCTPAGLVCVCSAHLDWKGYALNLVRGYDADNFSKLPGPVTDVAQLHRMDQTSGREQALRDFLKYADDHSMPIILAGDFNECSHLDWIEETKNLYGHAGVVIEWTHSKLLQEAGFVDCWREIHPNPVTHMGATWPSQAHQIACTSWAKDADERDRIDFIYHNRSRLRTLSAQLVGPRGYFAKGAATDADCESPFLESTTELPWPSDHKGVLVELELTASPLVV